MARGEEMTGLIAIGIGCRRACARADIVALVQSALAGCAPPHGQRRLFTIVDKRGDAELSAAAGLLGLELVFLPREALEAAAPRLLTQSGAAQRRFGLPSVAEAAALAGAGTGSRLLGPRSIGNGATCAIAFRDADTQLL
jgi:cobalt-precorrin 5A hydrolase